MGSKYTKRYLEEYKRDAIELVRSSGRTVTEAARELGISRSEPFQVRYGFGRDFSRTPETRGRCVGASAGHPHLPRRALGMPCTGRPA
ncbi:MULTISPECIES: transposase [Streptomyces]|uniref:Transposase remnant n=1 Tax=Streptomyces coelicolor (strain ATCC BAA-471 / A3(2) / M145) TaxID=100226 RepID=Q9RKG5_STRCO|nr:transposase [Streptomyces sp. SID7813]QFI43511.1 transposase [Streptomyces coelicolor A3(2)]CAB61796.1 putative transposase remnant [Streptomyces coelicolor A3(2)]